MPENLHWRCIIHGVTTGQVLINVCTLLGKSADTMRCQWSAINVLSDLAAQGLLWGVPLYSPHAGGKYPGGTQPSFHHSTRSGSDDLSYQHSLPCHHCSLFSCRAFLVSLLGKMKTVQGLLMDNSNLITFACVQQQEWQWAACPALTRNTWSTQEQRQVKQMTQGPCCQVGNSSGESATCRCRNWTREKALNKGIRGGGSQQVSCLTPFWSPEITGMVSWFNSSQ